MRINYIYGGIRHNRFMNQWYPIKFGYIIEHYENENSNICKLDDLDYIYRETANERSIRIGRCRAKKFEKLYRLGNVIYWIRQLKKIITINHYVKYKDKNKVIMRYLFYIEKNLTNLNETK